uniref:Uncharacterized protein n=1 Tax=Arundo donax TaxID=35708 RepID=A0A0A8YP48_ARUDO
MIWSRHRKIRSSFSLTSTLRCCCSGDPAAMPELQEKARMREKKAH